MITIAQKQETSPNALTRCDLEGLSTDTKPTDIFEGYPVVNGWTFFEMDTCEIYKFDEENKVWIKL